MVIYSWFFMSIYICLSYLAIFFVISIEPTKNKWTTIVMMMMMITNDVGIDGSKKPLSSFEIVDNDI